MPDEGATWAVGSGEPVRHEVATAIGDRTSPQPIFGAPIERAGVTIIPVARVRWGGGRGSGPSGAGGVVASPAGYIAITARGATFHPIRDPQPLLAVLLTVPLIIVASGINLRLILAGLRPMLRDCMRSRQS
jgi:hypothetical protein